MDEKRYPTIDEEAGIDMACEPVAVSIATESKSADGITEVHDWIDDLDWNRFPSLGPFSEEEAIARIEEAERDLNDPSKSPTRRDWIWRSCGATAWSMGRDA